MNKGMLGKIKISFAILTAIIAILFAVNFVLPSIAYSGSAICTLTGAYNVCTDYSDYAPTEIVTINGTGFTNYSSLQVKVIRPDGSSTTGDKPYEPNSWPTPYDTVQVVGGNFQYVYDLDGIVGTYNVEVLDGTNVLAIHTFTDGIGYAKSGYDKGAASWGTGNQAGYNENDWVQYQYTVTGITGAVPSFNIVYNDLTANKIMFQSLSNFRVCVNCPFATGSSVLNNGVPRPPSTDGTPDANNNLWYSFTPLNINYAHTIVHGAHTAADACNAPDTLNTPSADHCFTIDPVTISATNSHFPSSFSSGTNTITIFFEAQLGATYIWHTGHENLLSSGAGLYGSKAPVEAVPGTTFGNHIYDSWTTAAFNGAGGSGSNQHVFIDDQSAGSNGGIILPIPAVPLPTSGINITKITNPASASGVQFSFTGSLDNFNLDTDSSTLAVNSSILFGNLPPGTYTVTEGAEPSGWSFTSLSCTPTQSISDTTATITLSTSSSGVVNCTYTNTINKLTPTIATTLSATSVNVGTAVHDSSALTGATSTAGGTVTYTVYTDNACTLNAQSAGTKTVTNGIVPNSDSLTLAVGSYYWQAVYSGDSSNNGASSTCTEEHLTVNKADTTVSTQVHNAAHTDITSTSVPLGTTFHDSATVATQVGSFTIGGTVTYKFYTTIDCTGTSADQTVTVGTESSTATPGAGVYSYKVDYSGDANYKSSTGTCEPVTITKSQLDVSTLIHDSQEDVIEGPVALGSTVHDYASVTGLVSGFTPANVVFTFYTDDICDGQSTSAGSVTLVDGVAHPSDSEGPLAAGAYAFKASIAGDSNYLEDTSDCEPLTVNKADTRHDNYAICIPDCTW
ncbi:MAG: hypothetical protein V1678_02635 [Candidatus Aenigmatarchaeota archaeon]